MVTDSAAEAPTRRRPLGLAIVGCGQITTHHLSGMLMATNLEAAAISDDHQQQHPPESAWRVRALVDPNPERVQVIQDFLREKGEGRLLDPSEPLKHFDSLDQLLSDDKIMLMIDVVFIAVPHDLHESLALQALQSTTKQQQYIVLEKPVAITSDSCHRIVQASQQSNGRLIIAEQSPYWQEVVRARELIQAGAIGPTLVTAAAYYYESMRDNVTSGGVDAATGGLGWRGQLARAGGGIALDGGLHWIRPLRELCGRRVARVAGVVRCGLQPALQMEGESVGHALLELEERGEQPQDWRDEDEAGGPLVATYSCNMLATAPMAHDTCPYFRITGTGGELVIHGDGLLRHPGAGGLRLYNEEHPTGQEQFAPDRVGGFFLGFGGLWREIGRIVHTQDAAAAHESVVRAADDVRVVLALYRSSKSRQWEECT